MRGQRRPFVYIVLVTAIILVAVLAYRNFPGQSPTDKDAGFFTQAVNNYATCQKSASECASFDKSKIISGDPAKQAVVDGDGQTVTW